MSTKFGDFYIRRGDSDMRVLRQVFVERQYDLSRFEQGSWAEEHYLRIVRSGKSPLIIDAGANAGFSARFFAAKWRYASIIAVEPDPDNAKLCRANTRHLSNVHVVEAAIGSRPGFVKVKKTKGESWASRTERDSEGIRVVQVQDLKMFGANLFLIKVDIEGAELELFSDNTGWLGATPVVIVEPHDWLRPGSRSSWTLVQAMATEGRDLLILGDNLVWIKPPS